MASVLIGKRLVSWHDLLDSALSAHVVLKNHAETVHLDKLSSLTYYHVGSIQYFGVDQGARNLESVKMQECL